MERSRVKPQKASPKPSTTWQTWVLNLSLSSSTMSSVAPAVAALGLQMKEVILLAYVDEHPHPADLARALVAPKPTVTFLVKRQVAAGHLRRELETDDLRRFRLTLTASGRRALEAARLILERAFGERLARLTATERVAFGRILHKLVAP